MWLRIAAYAMAAGCALGLLVGWVIWPPSYVDASPALLGPVDQALYAELVALSFFQSRDLIMARGRLDLLDVADPGRYVESLALGRLGDGRDDPSAMALVALARALGSTSERLIDPAESAP
jgi:hypothetical protein